jgi:large subunit ribosomal protein L23
MKSSRIILRKPIITEKATWMKETSNKYVFEVEKDCNKIEIRQAVESQFHVTVVDVHTYRTYGKIKTQGRFRGRRPDWKRAVVQLKQGDTIEYFEGA